MLSVITAIARAFGALRECKKTGNDIWAEKHTERIRELVEIYFPSGSGFDSGCGFDFEKSRENKLVFYTSFHHMNNAGFYDGWSDHSVIVTPSLSLGFDVRVTGRNRNDIKVYIAELFAAALASDTETETRIVGEGEKA